MLKRALVSVCPRSQSFTLCSCLSDPRLRGNRIAVNSDVVQELAAICVGFEEARQNSRTARNERSSSEPYVQIIGRRKRRHRASLTHALFTQRRNRQPILDQSPFAHGVVSSILNDASTRRGYSRCITKIGREHV